MKRKIQIITSASAALFLTFTAVAQEIPNVKTGGTETSVERPAHAMRVERLGRAEKVSDLIGMEVHRAECCESNQVSEVYRYYGERPYFTGWQASDMTPWSEQTRSIDVIRAPDRKWNADEYRNI